MLVSTMLMLIVKRTKYFHNLVTPFRFDLRQDLISGSLGNGLLALSSDIWCKIFIMWTPEWQNYPDWGHLQNCIIHYSRFTLSRKTMCCREKMNVTVAKFYGSQSICKLEWQRECPFEELVKLTFYLKYSSFTSSVMLKGIMLKDYKNFLPP